MKHLSRAAKPVAAAAVLSIALVACGGDTTASTDDPTTTPMPTSESTEDMTEDMGDDMTSAGFAVQPESSGDPFADAKAAAGHVTMAAATLAGGIDAAANLDGDPTSAAANLRAGLTKLLQEHVYLAGYAIDTALAFGLDAPETGLATAALDENSVALADAVGSIAGDDNRTAFLDLWRQHIGFFVDYAVATATEDAAGAQAAQDSLSGYTQDAGAFFEQITGGELPADAVAGSLEMHITTLSAAIDSAVAGETSLFSNLKTAADHVVGSAETLAGGIAAAAGLEGDVSSAASGLHSGLVALLQEHVYLAGLAVKTAYTAGADSEAFTAAAETLDQNSVALADAIGSIAGDENRTAFLDLWRQHIGFFVDYAVATAGNDVDGQQTAISNLDGYTADAGAFFEQITGGELPADAIAESLRGHIATLAGAIDSLAAALL
jgi:hypothetical protein